MLSSKRNEITSKNSRATVFPAYSLTKNKDGPASKRDASATSSLEEQRSQEAAPPIDDGWTVMDSSLFGRTNLPYGGPFQAVQMGELSKQFQYDGYQVWAW